MRRVSFAVEIESPASGEDGERLVVAVNAHCPVLEILRQPNPVDLGGTLLQFNRAWMLTAPCSAWRPSE